MSPILREMISSKQESSHVLAARTLKFIDLSKGGKEGITFQKFVMPKFQETAREGTVNHLGIIPPLSITSTTMYQRTVVWGSWLWTTKCRSESQAGRTNPAPVTLYIVISHKLQPQLCPYVCWKCEVGKLRITTPVWRLSLQWLQSFTPRMSKFSVFNSSSYFNSHDHLLCRGAMVLTAKIISWPPMCCANFRDPRYWSSFLSCGSWIWWNGRTSDGIICKGRAGTI